MNQETAKGYNKWLKYGQAMLRMRGVEQDVTDNIISRIPQLILPKLPQIIPVNEDHTAKKQKSTTHKSNLEVIYEMAIP